MVESGFHANLVVMKKKDFWNGFACFGTSRHGKTPLSFALATRLLFRNPMAEIRIFDDHFELEGDLVSCKAGWAAPDLVGARSGFERAVLDCGRSVIEFEPNPTEKCKICAAVFWLLLDSRSENKSYDLECCSYDKFTDELKKTNCRWEYPPGSLDEDLAAIHRRLKVSWDYSLVYKTRTDGSTVEGRRVIDALSWQALQRFDGL